MALGFTIDVYYKGKSTKILKYGKCYMLDYCNDGKKEAIEIFDYDDYTTVLRIKNDANINISPRSHGPLFGHEKLSNFVEESEWERRESREQRLETLLNELDEKESQKNT